MEKEKEKAKGSSWIIPTGIVLFYLFAMEANM